MLQNYICKLLYVNNCRLIYEYVLLIAELLIFLDDGLCVINKSFNKIDETSQGLLTSNYDYVLTTAISYDGKDAI